MRGCIFGMLTLASACASYTPAPVSPDSQLEPYNRRTLTDPGLLAYFDSLGQPRPSGEWTARQLAIAASWFRADRSVRLAEIRAADASLITAGGHPQPGISTDLEYAFSDPQASSRWGLALAGIFTIELGGKRAARIGRAQATALAVRAAAAEAEWEQVSQLYSAVLLWEESRQLVATAHEERLAQDSVVRLTQARFEGGVLTRLDVSRSAGEQRSAIAAEQAAERDEAVARSGVARALGLPGSVPIEVGDISTPDCGNESRESLQRTALGTRWSVRRAAADYQVAEGDLRVEVANASPDLTLGPGLFFDQGSGKFTLGLGLPALALNRNRGPIGEAETRRAVAGARLMQAQEGVLADLDASLAGCETANRQADAAEQLTRQAESRLSLVQAAYARGETGQLEVVAARLEMVRVRRATTEARLRKKDAGLLLERAVGAYGSRDDGTWPAIHN